MRKSLLIIAALTAGAAQSADTLAVAASNQIFIYSIGAASPRLVITSGLAGVTQIAIDGNEKRYASNFGTSPTYSDSSVTEYRPGQTSPALTRTNGAFSAFGVAVDPAGNVYASSYYRNTISIYQAGEANPIIQLQNGVSAPGLLAYNNGDLYVGEAGTGQILRFPDGATSPDLTLTLQGPGSLPPGALTYGGPFVVATDGTVYGGGAVIASDLGYEEFVNVFAPGGSTPRVSVVVSTGSSAGSPPFVALAANSFFASASDIDSVFQYAIGPNPKLVRTITNGLNQPGPLAVTSRSHRLYVGNAGGLVTVYGPGATTPEQTISLPGFVSPVAMVIAP